MSRSKLETRIVPPISYYLKTSGRFSMKTQRIIEFYGHKELRVNNTFHPYKQRHEYTFENSRGLIILSQMEIFTPREY